MDNKIKSYLDLKVWQEGRILATKIYLKLQSFPSHEKYGICDQMRRAVVSVPSNIAEGFGRSTAKEKNQFYYIAKGSLSELETQLYIAFDIGYIDETNLNLLLQQTELVQRLLQGLITANKKNM